MTNLLWHQTLLTLCFKFLQDCGANSYPKLTNINEHVTFLIQLQRLVDPFGDRLDDSIIQRFDSSFENIEKRLKILYNLISHGYSPWLIQKICEMLKIDLRPLYLTVLREQVDHLNLDAIEQIVLGLCKHVVEKSTDHVDNDGWGFEEDFSLTEEAHGDMNGVLIEIKNDVEKMLKEVTLDPSTNHQSKMFLLRLLEEVLFLVLLIIYRTLSLNQLMRLNCKMLNLTLLFLIIGQSKFVW